MKKISIISLWVVIGLLLSCDDNNTGPVYSTLSGKILDAITYGSIHYAEITTTPPTSVIVTNTNGYYQIENLLPGSYEIHVS